MEAITKTSKSSHLVTVALIILLFLTNSADAQRYRRDPTTGKRAHPCLDLDCTTEEGSGYYATDIYCLECLRYRADSTMNSEYQNLVTRLASQKAKQTALIKNQQQWEKLLSKKVDAAEKEYEGAYMGRSEPVRITLTMTESRIKYLRAYKI